MDRYISLLLERDRRPPLVYPRVTQMARVISTPGASAAKPVVPRGRRAPRLSRVSTTPDPSEAAGRATLHERLEALRATHAPDPRVAVWDVAVEEAGGRRTLAGATSAVDAIEEIRRLAAAEGAEAAVLPLPDPELGAGVLAVAHRSLVHVRREPRHASELVTQLVLGEEALVLRERDTWLQLQGSDGYVGWAHRGSVVRRAPVEDLEELRERLASRRPPPGTWVVVARGAVALERPAAEAAPACDLVRGGRVAAVEEEEGWLRIALPDGVTGWLPGGAAVPHESLAERFPAIGEAILAHGAEHLGLPYLWGGTSEKGYDCSGFVQRIYGLHGVALPRDSDQQSATGEPVEDRDWSGVRDGDLAFFAETPGGRATHVGMLAAGGRLLHASTTRHGVAWDSLSGSSSDRTEFGERLAATLTAIRRVLR